VDVQLDASGAPQFDIISDVAYDYVEYIPEYHSNLIRAVQMIYFGSLIQRSRHVVKTYRHIYLATYQKRSISLTKGASGSALFTNRACFNSKPAEAINVVDTVGAGDAYAAMLAAGLLKKWQPEKIRKRASLFASRVCEIKGAIPDSDSFYEPFKPLFLNN
jgi:fructokinase